MREIKFRAWFPQGQTMDYNPSLSGFEYINDPFQRYRGNPIWMQYTGLKDKLGKEIYEGDVIRVMGKETETTTGEKRMVVDDAFSCYATLRDSLIDGSSLIDGGKPEVIGNIYSNPELIK